MTLCCAVKCRCVSEHISAAAAETPVFSHVCLLFGVVSSPAGYVTYQTHVKWMQNVISVHYTARCLFIHHRHSLRQQGPTVFATGISEGHFRELPSSAQSWNPLLPSHQFKYPEAVAESHGCYVRTVASLHYIQSYRGEKVHAVLQWQHGTIAKRVFKVCGDGGT